MEKGKERKNGPGKDTSKVVEGTSVKQVGNISLPYLTLVINTRVVGKLIPLIPNYRQRGLTIYTLAPVATRQAIIG